MLKKAQKILLEIPRIRLSEILVFGKYITLKRVTNTISIGAFVADDNVLKNDREDFSGRTNLVRSLHD